MRVPVSWLRELVAVDAPAAEIGERLARAGTSVESIERTGRGVSGVVVALVLEVADVPASDKLCVAQVDAGAHGRFQVVAGAKNFRGGDRVAFAKPGARVTTLDAPIGVRTMAGEYESQGMLCSAKELGVSEDHGGILVLDPQAPAGGDVAELLHLDDEVLELEITPNRPDLLSLTGVAREVAVLYGVSMQPWSDAVREQGPPVDSLASVEVHDTRACPRYVARVVEEVRFGPSPAAVQARLTACGFRPLGNLVDATNYALLLTGQPLHAFDLDGLESGRVVVRRAADGEPITTIDGTERKLTAEDLVIADASRPQAIAGVMGGEDSEVGPATERVLLESAFFAPSTVSRTARRLGLATEASRRFERGADPGATAAAAALCAELLRSWAAGRVAAGAIDIGQCPPPAAIGLRLSRTGAVIGLEVPADRTRAILSGLGCRTEGDGDVLDVRPPTWRPDLEREIDLIEEIARVHGYDEIPMSLPTGARGFLTGEQRLRRRIRDVMLGAGLSEATLPSFLDGADLVWAGDPASLEISNPLSSEQSRLRPTLLPGLLGAARRNVARGTRDVRLFELGTVFDAAFDGDAGAELPSERSCLGAILTGSAVEDAWYSQHRDVDVFDGKGLVALLLEEMGAGTFTTAPCDAMPFHPGRSAIVTAGGREIGRFGEVRPSVRRAFDLQGGAVVLEFDVGGLVALAPRALVVEDLPRFPPVTRDISLVVDESVPSADVEAAIREGAGGLAESVRLFDVYRGEQIPAGKRNLAYRLTLRSSERTLTNDEADAARDRAVAALRDRLGAEIR